MDGLTHLLRTPTTILETKSSNASLIETENGTTMLTTTPGNAHSKLTHEYVVDLVH